MTQVRSPAALDLTREPHSVSLKVLRLSRPSLSIQQPLPASSDQILSTASYAYPFENTYNDGFVLSPLLTLPPAFGYAYVGEVFSCTLCANNETPPGTITEKTINAVSIEAELKTPKSGAPIKLTLTPSSSKPATATREEKDEDNTEGRKLAHGQSLQKNVQIELKEEGNHILAVSVSYSEVSTTSGRVRTFRKLYQFVCKNCLLVRSKITAIPFTLPRSWALEAQLENCGEENIILERVEFNNEKKIRSKSLNWDVMNQGDHKEIPKLMPGDVQQVCFLIEEEDEKPEIIGGKLIFGTISVYWRGTMGNKGCLSTDPLGTKVI